MYQSCEIFCEPFINYNVKKQAMEMDCVSAGLMDQFQIFYWNAALKLVNVAVVIEFI